MKGASRLYGIYSLTGESPAVSEWLSRQLKNSESLWVHGYGLASAIEQKFEVLSNTSHGRRLLSASYVRLGVNASFRMAQEHLPLLYESSHSEDGSQHVRSLLLIARDHPEASSLGLFVDGQWASMAMHPSAQKVIRVLVTIDSLVGTILQAFSESLGESYVTVLASDPHGAKVLQTLVAERTISPDHFVAMHEALHKWAKEQDEHLGESHMADEQKELVNRFVERSMRLEMEFDPCLHKYLKTRKGWREPRRPRKSKRVKRLVKAKIELAA